MKPTKTDLAIIERAKSISDGWITEDRWLKRAYFGRRHLAKNADVQQNLGCKRIDRLVDLGLLSYIDSDGNYAFYLTKAEAS